MAVPAIAEGVDSALRREGRRWGECPPWEMVSRLSIAHGQPSQTTLRKRCGTSFPASREADYDLQ
jgi:hypothetical protein